MKTVEMAEATASLSEYAQQARKEAVIVTVHGKPVVALTPLRNTDWENLTVSNDPKFQELMQRSRATCKPGSGISSNEMRRRLGIKPKKAR